MNTNLQSFRSRFDNAAQTAVNFKNRAVAAGTTAMLVPFAALAQADPAAAISTEIAGVKTSVGGILVILAAVVGLMLLWSYIRRAK